MWWKVFTSSSRLSPPSRERRGRFIFRREFAINGLPIKQSSFKDVPEVRCVEYVTHGSVDQGLPRQVRYGYRPSNGYSEALTYRDSYWTVDGEVSHCIEFNATSRGVLKRSEVVSRNGEVLRKDVTHVQLGQSTLIPRINWHDGWTA